MTAGFALTDWANVYTTDDDGNKPDLHLVAARHGYFIEDCPGVYYEDGKPVFATQIFGGLIPAARMNPTTYVRTMPRSSFERWMDELDATAQRITTALGNGR